MMDSGKGKICHKCMADDVVDYSRSMEARIKKNSIYTKRILKRTAEQTEI